MDTLEDKLGEVYLVRQDPTSRYLRLFVTVVVSHVLVWDPRRFKLAILCFIPIDSFEHSMAFYLLKCRSEARISDKYGPKEASDQTRDAGGVASLALHHVLVDLLRVLIVEWCLPTRQKGQILGHATRLYMIEWSAQAQISSADSVSRSDSFKITFHRLRQDNLKSCYLP